MTRLYLYCSFCGKRQDEVAFLIAGPTVFICNECVELCVGILVEHKIPVVLTPIELKQIVTNEGT